MELQMKEGILSIDDFGDMTQYNSLSAFEILAVAARLALEKERESSLSLSLSISHSPQKPHLLDEGMTLPMSEKRPLPMDLNSEPKELVRRVKRARTTIGIPHQNPINFSALFPILTQNPNPHPVPEFPAEFREKMLEMGGSDPKLVLEKPLHKSDVAKSNARLSLPLNQIKLDLTKAEEEDTKRRDDKGNVVGSEVNVIEPRNGLNVRRLKFKYWEKVSSYVLVGSWNRVVLCNGLEERDLVQVWSFRCDPGARLSFALVKLN